MDNWLYFGCNQRAGHYLFERGMRPARTKYSRNLERFDGMLAPQDSTTPYVATVSRLAGWGMTALSFWDYSVDCATVKPPTAFSLPRRALTNRAKTKLENTDEDSKGQRGRHD